MARKKKTEESLHHLPEEIVEEILSRLPVKSLLRFRCVSKPWLSLIGSDRFIKSHLQYSTQNKVSAHHRVLIFTDSDSEPQQSKKCSLLALLDGANLSPLCYPISEDPSDNSGCCNGLLCVYERKRILLLNPTTSVSKELPEDPEIDKFMVRGQVIKIGFGWDESSGAYKVFAGWMGKTRGPFVKLRRCARLYSSKTNSWKAVENPYPYVLTCVGEGKFVGGKLHWLGTRMGIISSLDVKSEVFGTTKLPPNLSYDRCSMKLGVVGGCLCLSAEYYGEPKRAFDVWVMKESWEKLLTIHLAHEPTRAPYTHWAQVVIGEASNGEILIALETSLLVYCPRDGVIRQRIKIGSYDKVLLCVESLVSPVREITTLDI